MFQGNWQCSKCGGEIKELPFEPRGTAGLTCRDCYFKEKNGDTAGSDPAAAGSDNSGSSDHDNRDDVPPFDPDAGSTASEPAPDDPNREGEPAIPGERKMFEGNWSCSGCGNAINKLPFQPRNTENLKCIDCFKSSKA
tara:strand:+ start:5867 stop:6280 length:414 start_codon:yes stop_codon:yes gene_type:complete